MPLYEVATVQSFPAGRLLKVVVSRIPICLTRTEVGEWFAISDLCSHEEVSLSEGELSGNEVECPQHGSTFDIRNGKVTGPPAMIPIATYPVVVEDGKVYIEL